MKSSFSVILLLALLSGTHGFFQNLGGGAKKTPGGSAKASPLAQEAVEIFGAKYPFGRAPPKSSIMGDFGMPDRDLDGTKLKKASSGAGKRLTDISETEAAASFNSLAKIYGDERALEMTKRLPIILSFDKNEFSPCYTAWAEIFGDEETKEMVLRNPGLLAVPSREAAKATDQTMTFSYIVAYTRPLGPILLPILPLLLCVPLLEQLTGVPIRGIVFTKLGLL